MVNQEVPRRHVVFGAGGLLGGALVRRLEAEGRDVHGATVDWSSPDRHRDIEKAVWQNSAGRATYYWAAGRGVTSSTDEQLDLEVRNFQWFLHCLDDADESADTIIFLASSAGALFAGSHPAPFDDMSRARPLVAYGRAKLAMEDNLSGFAERTGIRAVVGRISNLFGPGQDLSKPQGLISHAINAALVGDPLTLWVPPETRRDYLFTRDAADQILAACGFSAENDAPGGCARVLLCDGVTRDAAGLIADIEHHLGLAIPVLHRKSDLAVGQVADLPFKKTTYGALDRLARTPFSEALAATVEDIKVRRA